MHPALILRRGTGFVATLLLLAHAGGVGAQEAARRTFPEGIRTGIGYAAVVPEVMAGASAWHLLGSGRFGVFADVKASVPDLARDGDFCPEAVGTCTIRDVDERHVDVKLRDVSQYRMLNAGVMITAGPEIAFLLGGGVARRSRYREYAEVVDDIELVSTDDGTYWVPFDPASEWGAQAVVGVLMRLSGRVVVRFGYETAPGGMSVGGYWTFGR